MNANELAFPNRNRAEPNDEYSDYGLTKREYFAAMAMQGFLANPLALETAANDDVIKAAFAGHIAAMSVECADALLVELERTKK